MPASPAPSCAVRRVAPATVLVLVACALAGPGRSAVAADGPKTVRWYQILKDGRSLGRSRVVWAPSTWNGKPTVHDTTTETTKSVRDMLGTLDEFSATTTIDLERSEDGTLWWERFVVQEADRTIVTEITWSDGGYDHVTRLGDVEKKVRIPLDAPVMTDVESTAGARLRAGTAKAGDSFPIRLLDVTARGARTYEVRILDTESLEAEAGPVQATKVEQVDPASGERTWLWLDADGALVRLQTEGGVSYRRVREDQADEGSDAPARTEITTPSNPPLERIFTADRVGLDLHVRGDPLRSLPRLPDSPWSRVVGTKGSDADGWVVSIELTKYDAEAVKGTLPVDASAFERDLEDTVLMPVNHPTLKQAVAEVVGEEKDLRKAAHLLVRFVFDRLQKGSGDIQQGDALRILEECRGDCSEHALLYVALCRAAGIPARLCSGYVCVGGDWGAHSWAEVWTGQWISADPSTGEVGGAARYLFFGYPDHPESYPGVVSARLSGRMRFVLTRVVEGDDDHDLVDPAGWTVHDREHGRYVHVRAGIELRDVPKTWVVRLSGDGQAEVRAAGLRASIRVAADQGYPLDVRVGRGGETTELGGAPARLVRRGSTRIYGVHSRRRHVIVQVEAEDDALVEQLGRFLAPTFAARPTKP